MVKRLLGIVECCLTGYDAVRIVLGILLLTAAVPKGYQLATEPPLGTGLLDAWWLLVVVIEGEIALGLALVAGIRKRLTWAAALACFSVFAVVSLAKTVGGEASCGCWGRMDVPPIWTACLDVTAAAALLLCRRARTERDRLCHQRLARAITGTLWCVLTTATLVIGVGAKHWSPAHGMGVCPASPPLLRLRLGRGSASVSPCCRISTSASVWLRGDGWFCCTAAIAVAANVQSKVVSNWPCGCRAGEARSRLPWSRFRRMRNRNGLSR